MAIRFDKLVDQWDPILQRAFLQAVYNMRDRAHLEQIAKMVERDDIAGALRAVGLDPESLRPLDSAIEQAFEAGGKWTQEIIPVTVDAQGFRTIFQFSIRNPTAEGWLRDESSTLIREIIDDQRTAARQFLQAGMEAGLNPRTVALDLVGRVNPLTNRREGGTIGLTSTQEEWVRNYQTELRSDSPLDALARELRDKRFDSTVRKAASTGEGIPDGQIAKMVTAYRNRALRYRAEAIGRTEAMRSLHQAQQEAITQAIGGGVVEAAQVTKTWRATEDSRTREAHSHLDGESVAFGGTFYSDLGPIRFPGDPLATPENTIGCRCWLEPNVNFLAGIE